MTNAASFLWGLVRLYAYLVPLVLAISVVYAATRHERWPAIRRHAVRLFGTMMIFMLLTTLVLWIINR